MIDVILLTKNSLHPCLPECVNSILREIPVGRLIVVDAGSTNGTLETINELAIKHGYGGDVFYLKDQGTRATARQAGLRLATHPLVAFVDSDVILCKGWFDHIQPLLTPGVGGVWGVALPCEETNRKYYQAMARLHGLDMFALAERQGKRRGLLHDTVVRASLLKDLRFPPGLHVWEDDYVKRHIINQGFGWITTSKAHCLHYKMRYPFAEDLLSGYVRYTQGLLTWPKFLIVLARAPIRFAYLMLATRDLKVMRRNIKQTLGFAVGYLQGWLHGS